MIIAWIGYCLLISGLLALAALASERALGHFRKPVRWAWFAAVAGSVTVPVVAFLAPGLLPGFGVSSAASAVGLSGPAIVGIRRSVVVMPKWIPERDDRLLRLVFLHEREHQRAGDHRLFAAAVTALVLMPWNLLVWWQLSRLRLAIEFDCDRRVLRRGESPRDYADALLTVGSRVSGPLLAAAAFAERKPAVERRLRRMTEPAASMRPLRTLGASGVVMVAVLFVLGCPGPETSVNAPEPPAATVTPPSESSEWAPPLVPGEEVMARGDRPSFIAYDRPPVLQNAGAVMLALQDAYPRDLMTAGIGGRVEVWLYLDASGGVRNSELKMSSGHDALDAAAADVVATMRFEPAMNRDQPTDVWVSQWVTFEVGDMIPVDGGPPQTEEPLELRDILLNGRPVDGDDADLWLHPTVRQALDPLIIVDGVMLSEGASLGDIQALDIGHVEIVKGERAVDLYGERARNGVVEITTKTGAMDSTDHESENLIADFDQDGAPDIFVTPAMDEAPLIIVDGVMLSEGASLADLQALDIDHVDVVKGERAVEMYGERARNGVVAITTKGGAADSDAPADQPTFVGYDTPPALQNGGEIQQAIERAYPSDLKQAGIGGRVEMWLYVDLSGAVVNHRVKTSSGNEALDRAAAEVVEQMRFRPASNSDELTAVWVSQWVTFQVI